MILANVRERLTPSDLQLVVDALSGEAADRGREYEQWLHDGEQDRLLDTPGLFGLLRDHASLAAPSPELFVYVAVRTTLLHVGIDDAPLSDYLSALLLRFGFRDRAYRISMTDDQVYRYVTDLAADLDDGADARRAFLLRAHLGNFSLWLSGVFPDYITARRARNGGPDFRFYETMGARGFRLASDHWLAKEWCLDDIYERAADRFDVLRVGLNRLSDELLFPQVSSADRLMRQVSDAMRLPRADN